MEPIVERGNLVDLEDVLQSEQIQDSVEQIEEDKADMTQEPTDLGEQSIPDFLMKRIVYCFVFVIDTLFLIVRTFSLSIILE